jgi:predicted neuraminidase
MLIFEPQKYFPQCHASTLTQLKDGRIFVAWFAGSKEANPDTAIWMSCLFPNEKVWSKPAVIAKVDNVAHWNPVLFTFNDKTYLFFKVGTSIDYWVTYCMIFENEKWSKPKELIDLDKTDFDHLDDQFDRGPVRSKPIVLSNGHWIAPSSVEKTITPGLISPDGIFFKANVVWKSFVDISKDEGKTWNKSKLIDFDRGKYGLKNGKYGGVIQPTLWESTNGNVHMLLRSTAGFIFRSDSIDYGETWSQAYPIELPNNNSGIDVIKNKGLLFLVYNPVSGNWAARTPLSLISSNNNGKTWRKQVHIQEGEGSFSYPSIVTLNDGIGVTYTWNRLSISFVKIKINFPKDVV